MLKNIFITHFNNCYRLVKFSTLNLSYCLNNIIKVRFKIYCTVTTWIVFIKFNRKKFDSESNSASEICALNYALRC